MPVRSIPSITRGSRISWECSTTACYPKATMRLSELYSSRLIPGSRPSVTAEPTLTIRRAGGRRIVAFLKILSSPGTKDSDAAGFQELVDKIARGPGAGYPRDGGPTLFPPGRFDPAGTSWGGLVARFGDEGYVIPPAQPHRPSALTTRQSCPRSRPISIRPMAFGDPLPAMPLVPRDSEIYYVSRPARAELPGRLPGYPGLLAR